MKQNKLARLTVLLAAVAASVTLVAMPTQAVPSLASPPPKATSKGDMTPVVVALKSCCRHSSSIA